MAKYVNSNKARGYFNNMNVDIKNRKSLMVPEILRGFQTTLKPGGNIMIIINDNYIYLIN
jgi:hypothetical protein